MATSTVIKRKSTDEDRSKDRKKQKKWDTDEETAMAEYIQQNYQQYKLTSKATFVRKMKQQLSLECEDEKQILNKVSSMEARYKSVKLETGNTGEGLTEGTMEYGSWEGYVKARCHFFFILDRVMKTRANIKPPFEINSTAPTDQADSNEDVDGLIADAEQQEKLFEARLLTLDSDGTEVGPQAKKNDKRKFIHKIEKGSASAIAEALRIQAELSGKHYERMDECKKLEVENLSSKLDIERERLRLDNEREERGMKLEEKKLEQQLLLETMRMDREREKEANEIDKLKLQIELEKLKKL